MKIFKFFIIFIAIIVVSVTLFVLAVTIFGKGSEVIVPQLVGKNIDVVKRSIPIIINIREYNMKYPKGTIISQTPKANSTTKKGHPILVDVSLGPKAETLPDFSNNLLQQAKLKIVSLNFKIGKIVYINSNKPIGTVIGQNPQAGTIYKQGQEVSLLASRGKKLQPLIMKNLVGKDSTDIINTFKSLNYKVDISKEYSLKFPINAVLNQDPKPKMLLKNVLKLTINSVSQYKAFVYVNYPSVGKLTIKKYVGENMVYSRTIDYNKYYMDYFFDYRPFTIKIYVNGLLVKEQNAELIK